MNRIFISDGTRSRKTVHDQFVGWFPTDKEKDVKYDSEINIEPLMTQTHKGKNLNEGELQNPSSFKFVVSNGGNINMSIVFRIKRLMTKSVAND